MELYAEVRRSVYVEGLSERAAARCFGLARETVRKMLRDRLPPGYRRAKPIRCPKLDAFTRGIDQILTDDQPRPKKQRHTAKRIWERLRAERAFTGGYTIVKDYGRRRKLGGQEMFVPLVSHYLFDDRFGRPGKGNDKGKVEGRVGYARRNFFVPVPRVASWDALNADLERQCRARRGQRLRRHTETIGERFARDRAALLPLPPVPYEACDTRPTRVTSLSLVRDRRNAYSVPTAYGHREVVVKGYVDTVVVVCGSTVIARHPRSYERDALIFEPLHYLALLERKTGALDQAAPLAGWELPEAFGRRRRLWEARLGTAGTREYVQVLRLLADFRFAHVSGAVRDALALGVIGFDAVKHLGLCRIEHRPPRLDLAQYPHLPAARGATTAAADYLALLGAGAA